jgi:hypothetical protein
MAKEASAARYMRLLIVVLSDSPGPGIGALAFGGEQHSRGEFPFPTEPEGSKALMGRRIAVESN